MNNPKDQRHCHTRYPRTNQLSDTYLQLEGFVDLPPDTEVIPPADVIHEATQLSKDSWTDVFITFGVMMTLLVISSVGLGYGVSKLTAGVQQIADHMSQPQDDVLTSPTSWRF